MLFTCEWYDPICSEGTCKQNHYNIIGLTILKDMEKFDPFIIAQNARQVYYLPYLGRWKSN